MCLAIPGKIIQINDQSTPRMGKVSFSGVIQDVCLEWVPEAKIGEYVVVHVGFALSIIDEKEAIETLQLFKQIQDSQQKEDTNGK